MKDKVAIVTGANSGIGKAAAGRLAREGANVVLADRNDPADVAREISDAGGSASPITTDVADEAQVAALIAHAVGSFGRLDALVNSAGVNRRGYVPDVPLEDFDFILGVNLKGTFLCCKHAIPAMRANGGGTIVNVASELAFKSTPNISIYSASKAAVVQLTKCLAVEQWEAGIRVNCVCPGPVDTPLLQGGIAAAPDPAARRRATEASTIMGRLGEPVEIANMIRFLASDEASFMTGAIVLVDGGVTAK